MSHPISRLARYGLPHRVQFGFAVVAMGLFAGSSGALAYMFKPIFDDILIIIGTPDETRFSSVVLAILGFSVLKGIGAYFSAYLMTDVGQRERDGVSGTDTGDQ